MTRDERAAQDAQTRAAFEHYAGSGGGAVQGIPASCVVLAVADLGILDACDCELAGRAVASVVGSASWSIPWERFQAIIAKLVAQCTEGALGTAEAGRMEIVAPEFLYSEPLHALFGRFAQVQQSSSSGGEDDGTDGTTGEMYLGMERWRQMLDGCGLLAGPYTTPLPQLKLSRR